MVRRAVFVASLLACVGVIVGADEPEAPEPPTGFALVELFTSEGCSSCPPADSVASDVAKLAASEGTPVYVLAFHVDYWDYLGWRDPYGNESYSARQRAYAKGAGSQRVYTPQIVVNGTVEFVGSDRDRARAEVAKAVEGDGDTPSARVRVEVEPRILANLQYRVAYEVEGLTPAQLEGAVLHVAVVEDGLSTDVARGENAGKTLRHDRVVRWFDSRALESARGTVRAHVPARADLERTSVVAWVQAGEVGPVLAGGEGRMRGE